MTGVLTFIFTIGAFAFEVGWRFSSLFSVERRHIFTELTRHSAECGKFSIPISVPVFWDHFAEPWFLVSFQGARKVRATLKTQEWPQSAASVIRAWCVCADILVL